MELGLVPEEKPGTAAGMVQAQEEEPRPPPGPATGSLRFEEDEGEEEDILEAWRRRRHSQLQRLGLTKLALCARESPERLPSRQRPAPAPQRRLQLDSDSSDDDGSE